MLYSQFNLTADQILSQIFGNKNALHSPDGLSKHAIRNHIDYTLWQSAGSRAKNGSQFSNQNKYANIVSELAGPQGCTRRFLRRTKRFQLNHCNLFLCDEKSEREGIAHVRHGPYKSLLCRSDTSRVDRKIQTIIRYVMM